MDRFNKALVCLIREYETSKTYDFVRDPVAYALYMTWRQFDEDEAKLKEVLEENERPN